MTKPVSVSRREIEGRQSWKDRITGAMIAEKLAAHMHGKKKLSPTQVRAAEILLARLEPTLSSVEQTIKRDDKVLSDEEALASITQVLDRNPSYLAKLLSIPAIRTAALATLADTVTVMPSVSNDAALPAFKSSEGSTHNNAE